MTGFYLPEDTSMEGELDGLEGDSDRCACCGAKISYRCVLDSKTTGRRFWVGRKCASNMTDVELAQLESAERKAIKAFCEMIAWGKDGEKFRTWAATQPHPKRWKGKTLQDDARYWAGRSKQGYPKLKKMWKAFGKGDATDILAAADKAEDLRTRRRKSKEEREAAYELWLKRRDVWRTLTEDYIQDTFGFMAETMIKKDGPDWVAKWLARNIGEAQESFPKDNNGAELGDKMPTMDDSRATDKLINAKYGLNERGR